MRNCDKCGNELVPVELDRMRRLEDFPQYKDALIIEIAGNYGMLIDPIFGIPPFILCKDCGVQFFKNNSWAVTEDSEHLIGEENA